MGICSSKAEKSSHGGAGATGQASGQEAAPPAAVGATPAEGSAKSFDTSDMPATPGAALTGTAAAAEDGSTPQMHTYNSTEKPTRSALRPSLDMPGGKSPGAYSRKTSSALSSVGFNVTVNAPEAEGRESSFTGADSISLKKIVDMFYDKVLANNELRPFFENIDMQKLKKHQVRFMGLAFGGKDLVFEEDPNLNLRKVHYHLIRDKGLTLEHWETFVGLFDKTLEQLSKEIPQETRDAAKRSIHATKHYFVPIGQETEYTNSTIAALPDGTQ